MLDEPLIVLFVSVFDVPENRVSNCDNNTLPSVPPSETKISYHLLLMWIHFLNLLPLSIFTIVSSTLPNSNALPPEFTFKTSPAEPIDKDNPPIPPCDKV